MLCCHFEAMIGEKLPFKRAIALEYGEGHAITGLTQCHIHGECYRFQQLTYHPFDSVAVYGLIPITTDYYTSLQQAYCKLHKPRWPIWVPPTQDQIPIAQYEQLIILEDTIWSHGKLELVVAARDIINAPIRAVIHPPRDLNGHAVDWFGLLGL